MREDVPSGAPYAQPTPRLLYVHDDLGDLVRERCGPDSAAAAAAADLLALARSRAGVRVISLAEQLDAVIAQGAHEPFDEAVGIGRAGVAVARALHARAGWFPRIREVSLTRQEDGRGGYELVGAEPDAADPRAQLRAIGARGSLAIVDDTVFSGLTMEAVLAALPPAALARTHAFCLRGVAASIAAVARRCPVVAGLAAPGRALEDVSFINASGLVLGTAIRRRGARSLAFYERPDWIRAWFPGADGEVLALCRRLAALLGEPGAGC